MSTIDHLIKWTATWSDRVWLCAVILIGALILAALAEVIATELS